MKILTKYVTIFLMIILIFTFVSCLMTDKDFIFTTNDGFKIYDREIGDLYDQRNLGQCIIDIPNSSEIIIPEYVNNKKVSRIGYYRNLGYGIADYSVIEKEIRKLTIQHEIIIDCHIESEYKVVVRFPNLDTLIFNDYIYCNLSNSSEEIMVPYYIGEKTANVPDVELRKTSRKYNVADFKPKVIFIPDYVKVIEKGVFDGLGDVVLKTSYDSKPEEWEDGWNGSCKVIWGETITYMSVEDHIEYIMPGDRELAYFNPGGLEDVYITDCFGMSIDIPEYILGKKVAGLGYKYEKDGIIKKYIINDEQVNYIRIEHEFSIYYEKDECCVSFPNLRQITYYDFLYCNLSNKNSELIVPYYIGSPTKNVPEVYLKKSKREYGLNGFKPKIIIIPEYVIKIEKGVFDGLEDVVIKTSYDSKPEGWEDGWNGKCNVIWGCSLEGDEYSTK